MNCPNCKETDNEQKCIGCENLVLPTPDKINFPDRTIFTKSDALNFIQTRLSNSKSLSLTFVQSLFCQLNTDCTACPLFIENKEDCVVCSEIKDD